MARMAPHKVALHGHELSYVDSGSGPAVLFIHGILGSQRQWSRLVDRVDDVAASYAGTATATVLDGWAALSIAGSSSIRSTLPTAMFSRSRKS